MPQLHRTLRAWRSLFPAAKLETAPRSLQQSLSAGAGKVCCSRGSGVPGGISNAAEWLDGHRAGLLASHLCSALQMTQPDMVSALGKHCRGFRGHGRG